MIIECEYAAGEHTKNDPISIGLDVAGIEFADKMAAKTHEACGPANEEAGNKDKVDHVQNVSDSLLHVFYIEKIKPIEAEGCVHPVIECFATAFQRIVHRPRSVAKISQGKPDEADSKHQDIELRPNGSGMKRFVQGHELCRKQ